MSLFALNFQFHSRLAIASLLAIGLLSSLGLSACATASVTKAERTGYLVIAHGSVHHAGHGSGHAGHGTSHAHHAMASDRSLQLQRPWEAAVLNTVKEAKPRMNGPVEVAFGMWDHDSFQEGIDKLASNGVTRVHVIPLFVNSHSSVIRGQKYQFGIADKSPEDLPPLTKVKLPASVRLTYGRALDESQRLTNIIKKRATELAKAPEQEELILVAHGPVSQDEDAKWIGALAGHGERLQESVKRDGHAFHALHVVSLRDDAPAPVRDQATRKLRSLVEATKKSGREALILPVLIASGGIDKGLVKRLKGLNYRYTGAMLAPDTELVEWIVESSR